MAVHDIYVKPRPGVPRGRVPNELDCNSWFPFGPTGTSRSYFATCEQIASGNDRRSTWFLSAAS
jgi:hypothetical protein